MLLFLLLKFSYLYDSLNFGYFTSSISVFYFHYFGVLFLQFRVVLMSFSIPLGLLVDAFLELFGKIDTRLVS